MPNAQSVQILTFGSTVLLPIVLAAVPPVIAFFFWQTAADVTNLLTDLGTWNAGKNVDGNQFAVNLLRPTINGIVVPVVSIALGTPATSPSN